MKIDHDTFLLWLDDYCGGALDPAQRRAVEAYLEEHPEDRVEVQRQEALRAAFTDLPRPAAPRELREGVLSRLREEKERGMGQAEDAAEGEGSRRAAVVAAGEGMDLARARARRRRLAMRFIQVAAVAVIAVSAWRLTILSRQRAEQPRPAASAAPATAPEMRVAQKGVMASPETAAKAEEETDRLQAPASEVPLGSLQKKVEPETSAGRAGAAQTAGTEKQSAAAFYERRAKVSGSMGLSQYPIGGNPLSSREMARPEAETGSGLKTKEAVGQAPVGALSPSSPPASKPEPPASYGVMESKPGYFSPEASNLGDKMASGTAPPEIKGHLEGGNWPMMRQTVGQSDLKEGRPPQASGGLRLSESPKAAAPKSLQPPSSSGTGIRREELGWDTVGRVPPPSFYAALDTLQGAVRDRGGEVKETLERETPRVVVLMPNRTALKDLGSDLSRMGWRVESFSSKSKRARERSSVTSGTERLRIRAFSLAGGAPATPLVIPLEPPGGGRILLDVRFAP